MIATGNSSLVLNCPRPLKTRAKVLLFLTIKAVNKDMESKEKFADNHVNNISRLSDA